jgi:trk system potassium uptake protein TrkA
LKEMGVRYILAKAGGSRQKQILESIGVDRVVLPEEEMGERVAYSFITNDLMEYIHRSGKYDVIEMKPQPQWIGKSLQNLRLRQTEGINIIAIIREKEVMAILDGETTLSAEDDLILLKSRT